VLRVILAVAAFARVAHAEPDVRDRFIVGAAVGYGTAAQADARAGWMVAPGIAVFGSVVFGSVVEDATDDYRLFALGARVWFVDRVFVDARAGMARVTAADERNRLGVFAGAGVELLRERGLAFELHGEVAGGYRAVGFVGGLGVSFY